MMLKKKKQKWFEINGTLLEKRWAIDVISVDSVDFIEGKDEFNVFCRTESFGTFMWRFSTKGEAEMARESLVNWIKDVQG